ncbi:MAG: ribonucleoside triphosphate reductase, partial [Lentisphaeria bacterium]|nr:ribonucleoside triphosphate reductase [Lentisphaeria bacterium]
MYQVQKRDGKVVDFNISKIANAIRLAFDAQDKQSHPSVIDFLALKVTADFESKIKEGLISVEDIQDSVEAVLVQGGYADVAKAYIIYRRQHEQLRNVKSSILDYKKTVDDYIKINDWRVKENSTVTYSVGGLILSNSGAITANYWLSEGYDEEIANAHYNADIHLHDLSMLTGYCAGWSLKQLIQVGLGGVGGKITSNPAKHLATLCNQMVNFLGIMQNEWAGAQAFSSFDTYLAPFVKADNLSYEQVKKCIESFIFGVNTPSRWGTQAPFSNITLDWTVPNDLAELNAIVGGKEMPFKYKDCKKEMDMVNRAFIETMIEGDANGRGFQYPIPTYSITRDFDWSETDNNKLLF